jgi:hypothetical protein
MRPDSIDSAVKGSTVSRRWLLRSTVNLTAGAVAVSTVGFAAAEPRPSETAIAPDHDPVTGEIVDRERHHHWDTV